MDNYLVYCLLTAAIGFFAGYIYSQWRIFTEFGRLVDEFTSNPTTKTPEYPQPLQLQHTIIDGVHYFYTSDGKFVGQGDTLDVAAKHYSELAPRNTVGFFTHSELGLSYCFIDGSCKRCVFEKI